MEPSEEYPNATDNYDDLKYVISHIHYSTKKHYQLVETRQFKKYYIKCVEPELCKFRLNYNYDGVNYKRGQKSILGHEGCGDIHIRCRCYSRYLTNRSRDLAKRVRYITEVCNILQQEYMGKIEYFSIYEKIRPDRTVDLSRLELLQYKIREQDPRSYCSIEISEEKFKNFMIIDQEWRRLYQYQKRIIFCDACHLWSRAMGILFSITTFDANRHILLLGIINLLFLIIYSKE